MKKNILKTFVFLGIFVFAFVSCESDEVSLEPDNQSVQDGIMTESAVNDVVSLVNNATRSKSIVETTCGNFVFNQETNTLTISFPEDACVGENGISHSGTIQVQFTGTWQELGSKAVVTFEGFKRDGVELSGTLTMSFTATGTLPAFDVTATNMSLTFEDGSTITWEGSTTFVYYGLATPLDFTDDYFEINSAISGTTKEGTSFAQIATNLQTSLDCQWFIAGELKITIADNEVYNLNFKEPCGTVEGTYNGIPFTLNLAE